MQPFLKIPNDCLENHIGKKLHIKGSPKPGSVFRLTGLTETHMLVETPAHKRKFTFLRSKALYIREDEPKGD
jgi:hypothetical protein